MTRRRWLGLAAATALPLRAARAQQAGGHLIVAAESENRNLNPALIASNAVFFVSSKVIEPLFEMRADGGLDPRLALGAEPSADGRSLTLSLRPGVSWHDGKPFTAADVQVSALQLWKAAQNVGRTLLQDLEAVETPDALTAVLRFGVPIPPSLLLSALPIISSVVPKHLYDGTDVMANPANMRPVGTGPFVFDSHSPNVSLTLKRNGAYWDNGRPLLAAITYRAMPDRSTVAAALEAGEIHLAAFNPVPLTDLERLGKVPGVQVVREGYDGLTYQLMVEINHRRKELADGRVRRAIAHAIDADAVARTIFLGTARPANGPIPAFDRRFHDATVKAPAFDRAKAEALLDEAGLKRGSNGMRLTLKLLPAPWFEQTRQFGAYLRQALKAVGIEVEIVSLDAPAHLKAVYTDHAFDLAIGSPVYRNDPAISTTVLYDGNQPNGVPFTNQYGYRSEVMDGIIRRGATTLDLEGRAAAYRDFQRLAAEDLPIIPVVEFTFVSVARRDVRDVGNNPRWATSHWADCWLSR